MFRRTTGRRFGTFLAITKGGKTDLILYIIRADLLANVGTIWMPQLMRSHQVNNWQRIAVHRPHVLGRL